MHRKNEDYLSAGDCLCLENGKCPWCGADLQFHVCPRCLIDFDTALSEVPELTEAPHSFHARTGEGFAVANNITPNAVEIWGKDGKLAVRIGPPPECRIEFGEGVTTEEAAKKFWEVLAGFVTAAWNDHAKTT